MNQEVNFGYQTGIWFSRSFFSPHLFKKKVSATNMQLQDDIFSYWVALRSKLNKPLLLPSTCREAASVFFDFHWQKQETNPRGTKYCVSNCSFSLTSPLYHFLACIFFHPAGARHKEPTYVLKYNWVHDSVRVWSLYRGLHVNKFSSPAR